MFQWLAFICTVFSIQNTVIVLLFHFCEFFLYFSIEIYIVIVLFNKFDSKIGQQKLCWNKNLVIVLIDVWRLKNEKKLRFSFLQETNWKRYKEKYYSSIKFISTRMTSNEYNIRDAQFCINIQFDSLVKSECCRLQSSRNFFNLDFQIKILMNQ